MLLVNLPIEKVLEIITQELLLDNIEKTNKIKHFHELFIKELV